jgi:hypothetical protein
LQFAFEAEETAVAFLPASGTEEVALGGDGRTVESQVHAYHHLVLLKGRFGDIDHDMQPPASVAETQVSRSNGMPDVLLAEAWNAKPDRHLACAGGKADGLVGPIEGVGMHIVADRTLLRLWAFHWFKDGNLSAHVLCFSHAFGVGGNLLGEPG